MARTRTKRRGLALAALIGRSVTALTAGFPGQTAAQSPAEAVEYNQGTIEVTLDSAATVSGSNVTVTVNGAPASISSYTQTSPRRLKITVDTDIRPIDDAKVSFANSPNVDGEIDIRATGATVDLTDGVTPRRIYAGTSVAIVTSDADSAIDILKDGSRLTTRGTGPSSTVYVYDSTDSEIGANYTFVDQDTEKQLSVSFADLDLSVSAPSTVTTGEPFNVTAMANGINRDVEFRLVDSDGDVVDRAVQGLGSNGMATTALVITDTSATGDYTIVVTDADTGVSATSDTVTATSASTPTPSPSPTPTPSPSPTPTPPPSTPTPSPSPSPSPTMSPTETATQVDDGDDIVIRVPGFGASIAVAALLAAALLVGRRS